jgi:hypothetical protein
LTSPISQESLQWLQAHKDYIHETANVFVDAQDPIKRPHTGDVGTPEPPLGWSDDDQKKEALVSLIFVHRVVGRYLPCAIIFRLLAVASNFACGTEPLKILKTLLDADIVTLVVAVMQKGPGWPWNRDPPEVLK